MRLTAFFKPYKIYTYASLGEKNRIENEELHTFAPFESNRKTMQSAAPHSQILLNFFIDKHFRMFAGLYSKICLLFAIMVQNSPTLIYFFRNFSNLYGKLRKRSKSPRQILNFSGISQRILKISGNNLRKVRRKQKNISNCQKKFVATWSQKKRSNQPSHEIG